jgi:hypothetical protein
MDRQAKLELQKNGINNYSHRRLMGHAEADPEKTDPAAQVHEHDVARSEVISNRGPGRFDKLLARLPPQLHPIAKRIRPIAKRMNRIIRRLS